MVACTADAGIDKTPLVIFPYDPHLEITGSVRVVLKILDLLYYLFTGLRCDDRERVHGPHLFIGIPGDFSDTVIGIDRFTLFHDDKAVLNIISHHPEPLFAFPNLSLGKNMFRHIFKDERDAFSPIFKNRWDAFLMEDPLPRIFDLEGNGGLLISHIP